MAYMLGQYNYVPGQDTNFMTLLDQSLFEARRRTKDMEEEVDPDYRFEDECLYYSETFQDKCYYFHGKIRRLETSQTFYIKLVNYDETGDEAIEQYIKTIVIGAATLDTSNLWVDVEFSFTPIGQFDCLLFELVRTIQDWQNINRTAKIIYEEVSLINDIIPSKMNTSSLIKVGVQSRPGDSQTEIDAAIMDIDNKIAEIMNDDTKTNIEKSQLLKQIPSVVIMSNKGDRPISGFTIDYMYKVE